MKRIRSLCLAVAMVMAVLTLFGCPGTTDDPESDSVKVTITFDSDGGNAVASITIDKGTSMGSKYPVDPTKGTDIFKGWWVEEKQYAKDTKIDNNITLKAKWETRDINKWLVTFDTDGGSQAPDSVQVAKNGTLGDNFPVDPTRTDYDFKGWFDGDTRYENNTQITKDVTLKAKWELKTFTPGTAVVNGNQIIHENPALTVFGNEGVAVLNPATGAVTLGGVKDGGGFSYEFPSGLSLDWADCLDIKIEYTLTVITGDAKIAVKDGKNSFADIDNLTTEDNQYPTLQTGESKFLTYKIASFQNSINDDTITPGISFQFNQDGGGEFTVTVTKVTFTKAEPFVPGTPQEVEGNLVHENPKIDGINGAVVDAITGAVSLSGYSQMLAYKFPADVLSNYATITIYYTAVRVSGSNNFIQGNIKEAYNSWTSIDPAVYPNLTEGDDSLTYELTKFKDAGEDTGISIQNNKDDCTIKITKIVFAP